MKNTYSAHSQPKPDKKSEKGNKARPEIDSESNEGEINPQKLEREESSPDQSGSDNSKGHEPYEFKQNNAGSLQSYRHVVKEIDINKLGKDAH